MINAACNICHFDEKPIEYHNLTKLEQQLSRKVDKSQVTTYNRYNWAINPRCKYGISGCNKINNYKRNMNKVTQELDILLTGYIEQTDCEDYRQILQQFRGTFPQVYRDFERDVHKKHH